MHEAVSQARFEQEIAAIPESTRFSRCWKIHGAIYPILDVEFYTSENDDRPGLRLRMDFCGWNSTPPSIVLLRPHGERITQLLPPKSGGATGVFNQGPHPCAHAPFICMRGSREYHIHPSHTADLWDNIKGTAEFNLGGIVTQIWRAWQKDRP